MRTDRLDNFTDAAFAFAVTLLVIGGSEAPTNSAMLMAAVAEVPAFAIGFAIIAMFWSAHVRWRSMRGEGDWRSVVLSILLVFLVLIYVQPLRAMARSLSTYLGGAGTPFSGSLSDLFLVYGAGFVAMAAAMAALFAEALRSEAMDAPVRRAVKGEVWIWVTLILTGLVSVLLTRIGPVAQWAPMVYATLPLSIGLFSWRWYGRRAAEPEE